MNRMLLFLNGLNELLLFMVMEMRMYGRTELFGVISVCLKFRPPSVLFYLSYIM